MKAPAGEAETAEGDADRAAGADVAPRPLRGRAPSGFFDASGSAAGVTVTGDERGGKIPNGVGNPAAMNAVRTHCQQFGKKAYITQMNLPSEGGLLAFECH